MFPPEPEPSPVDPPDQDKPTVRQSIKVARLLVDAFDSVGNTSQLGGLETSKWALGMDGAADQDQGHRSRPARPAATAVKAGEEPKRTSSAPTRAAGGQSNVADVDNADTFMAAVRKRVTSKATKETREPQAGKKTGDEEGRVTRSMTDKSANTGYANPKIPPSSSANVDNPSDSRPSPGGSDAAQAPATTMASTGPAKSFTKPSTQESREHQLTFESWGTPAPRHTPVAQIRGVVLWNLPSWLFHPNMLFPLVHGGRIESIVLLPSRTAAQVIFCDPSACRRYYDMYPNGFNVSLLGRTVDVFVDLGLAPEVMSSRIREATAQGATRIVKATGAGMELSMKDLVELSEGANYKVEKILDVFTSSSEVRVVTFRFCSIDAALRFRATLSRKEDWEQANIQFGDDPCEKAKDIHWD